MGDVKAGSKVFRAFLVFAVFLLEGWGEAKTYLTHQEALKLAFPGEIQVERLSLTLTVEQVKTVERKAGGGINMPSKVVKYYRGTMKGEVTAYAFMESHVVRSKTETFMAVVNPNGTLRFVEMLAFDEPEEYGPTAAWLNQFRDKKLEDALRVKRGLSNMAGASLTSLAMTDGVRRILATFPEILKEESRYLRR